MQSHVKLLLYALTFFCVISYGLSIKCFDCRSDNDPKCGEDFDNSTLPIVDCKWEKELSGTIGSRLCRKIKKKVQGEWQYSRGCAYPNAEDFLAEAQVMESYVCGDKDGCNTSSMLAPIPLLVLLITLSSAMFKIFA